MSREPMPFETLEPRRLLAAAPVLTAIPRADVPIGKTLQIPLTTAYDGSDSVVYTIKSTSKTVVPTLHTVGNTFVEFDVAGYSDPMVFELFDNATPETVRRFTGLVNAGFYSGLVFQHVVNNFVIQGGDPTGTGTGGADFKFDDEFNPNEIFSGTGQLAMANSTKDGNSSQFFITEGPQRLLDFNYTIFGQLVRGEDTRASISDVDTDGYPNYRPLTPVTITRAKVIADTTDAVLQIRSLSSMGGTVRVTATTAGGSSSESFSVAPFTDTFDDPPIMNAVPDVYYIAKNTSLKTVLTATDLQGDTVHWGGQRVTTDGLANAIITDASDGGHLTVTPVTGYTGVIKLVIGVGIASATTRGSETSDSSLPLKGIYDTQVITVAVGDSPIVTTAYPIDAAAGVTLTNAPVATFRDADTTKKASSFTASIDWGDGTVTRGTVYNSSRAGYYTVLGTKRYGSAASGALPLGVTVSDAGGATSTGESTATLHNYASLAAGVLTVYGTSANDRIGIGRKGAYLAVSVNGQSKAFAVSDVTRIDAYALAGRDRITVTADVICPAYLDGGDGNDTIYGGGGPEVINAGAGNDLVQSGDGGSRVAGGAGNDTLLGGGGRDRLFGGDGNDSISGGPGRDILGGDAGNDTLLGGTSNDTLYGGDGDDTLNGMGGANLLNGGTGYNTAKKGDLDTCVDIDLLA